MESYPDRKRIKLNHHHLASENHPDHLATDDPIHLLKVFPEEVWCFILKDVDAVTFHKICGASSYFERLLSPQRIHILFLPVMDILMDHDYKWLWEVPWDEIDYDNDDVDVDDHEMSHLRKMLNWRLVCRAWKNGVNYYLQNLPRWYQTNFNYIPTGAQIRRSQYMETMEGYFTNEFLIDRDFTRFNDKFKDSHLATGVNPLPARRILIEVDSYSYQRVIMDFYTEFLQWLRHYGACIVQHSDSSLSFQPWNVLFGFGIDYKQF